MQVTPGPTSDHDIFVWLVEDNEFYRHTIEDLLNQSERFVCASAFSSCEQAVEALEIDAPPDVILLDIVLPGISGIDGIRRFKSISPTTHVVILTIHDDDDNLFRALSAGASGYLLKNSPKEKILQSLVEVMNGGAPMNAQIAKKVLNIFARLTAPDADYKLTNREREVLRLLTEGHTKKQIAELLYLSYHTIDNHIRNIYSKLHVHTRTAAVAKALKEKLS